ncbi:MAG: putative metal-binding motif-containing protein [Myxococcota bacterium]
MRIGLLFLAALLSVGCGDKDDDSGDAISDRDGDGFTDDDCDDSDPNVNPLATEECDEIDNNCDGRVDEPETVSQLIWYSDLDGDGYGTTDSVLESCEQPFGYASEQGDCDDQDATSFPGAVEICGDQKDNDCNGAVDDGC